VKGRPLGCALLLFAGVLLIAWWLPKTQTAFWSILIGGLAAWIGGIYLKVRLARPDTTLGSARFGGRAAVNALAKNSGDLLIGRDTFGRLLRYDGPAHLITIAPTRSGKGVGTIIPNLLTANRSVVCIDPKGENARVTLRQREAIGPVHCLDPFGISGRATARYNPLDRLEADSLDLAEDAMTLADALVFDENETEAHWNDEAKALISGIILYVICHDDPAHRNLTSVRDYLTLAPDDFAALLTVMQASDGAGGLIARAANRYLSKSHREPVERAMGLMAGYGLQLWPILQDIHQLRSLYGKNAGTFLSNAGVLQAFGVNDYDTADMLSKTMGRETITYETGGQSEKDVMVKDSERSVSKTQHLATRNLMDPNEIMNLAPDTLLVMRVGENPLIVRKLRYYTDKEFAGLFDTE
jgi:type IV secretory pathway TraG/TraD family ATPase VirD4